MNLIIIWEGDSSKTYRRKFEQNCALARFILLGQQQSHIKQKHKKLLNTKFLDSVTDFPPFFLMHWGKIVIFFLNSLMITQHKDVLVSSLRKHWFGSVFFLGGRGGGSLNGLKATLFALFPAWGYLKTTPSNTFFFSLSFASFFPWERQSFLFLLLSLLCSHVCLFFSLSLVTFCLAFPPHRDLETWGGSMKRTSVTRSVSGER